MKFAVVGCGSIGRRHIANLLNLKQEVVAYNRSPARRQAAAEDFGIDTFDDLEQMFEHARADMAVICSPNSCHYSDMFAALEKGMAVFVEKPLASHTQNLDKAKGLIDENNLFCHVGANMRYHPGPATIKKLLKDGYIGRSLWAELWGRMYLPDWHPQEDHRQMYSARRDLDGGALLDFVHEFDLLHWLFGKPDRLTAMITNTGWLEIEMEEAADVTVGYTGGLQVHVHVDYLERPAQRGIRIIGEEGSIVWDLNAGEVLLRTLDGRESYFQEPAGWEKNDMYIQQWKDVIEAYNNKRPGPSSFDDGRVAVELVELSKQADKQCNRALWR